MITNLEALKTQADIVNIISAYIPLKKAGVNYTACCPFHNEKTPSFMVNENKQMFKCFGCGEGGDVFSFVQKIEKIDFNEAAKRIAQMSNFTLEFDTKQAGVNPSEILERVNAFAKAELKKQATLCKYLYERGFNESDIDTYDIGYLPPKKELLAHFSESELLSANIANEYEKGAISIPLHHRIIFAIRNPFHKIVAFVGRTHNAYEFNKNAPKYINSKESYFYKKSQILYMYSNAKSHIAREKKAFIVEGYIDCLMLHKVGIAYALATGGTAFNVQHLNLLTRLNCEIIFCFDNDRSGMEANLRAIEVCFKAGVYNISIALLRNKKNSALGNHSADLGICEEARTLSPLTSPQIPKNYQSNTANPRILENDSSENAKNKEAQGNDDNKNSKILEGKSVLRSFERGDKTEMSIAQAKNKLADFHPKAEFSLCKDINEALLTGQNLDFKILSGFAFYTKMLFKKFPKPQAFDILKDKIKGIENYYIREAFLSEASEILGINPLEFAITHPKPNHTRQRYSNEFLKTLITSKRARFLAQELLHNDKDLAPFMQEKLAEKYNYLLDAHIHTLDSLDFDKEVYNRLIQDLQAQAQIAKAQKDIHTLSAIQAKIQELKAKIQSIFDTQERAKDKSTIIEVVDI